MHRLSLLLLLVLSLFVLLAEPSFANVSRKMQGHPGPDSLSASCDANGGIFSHSGNLWDCVKQNCDGKGGDCAVMCDKYGCYSNTPNIVPANTSVIRILNDVRFVPLGPAATDPPAAGGLGSGNHGSGIAPTQGKPAPLLHAPAGTLGQSF